VQHEELGTVPNINLRVKAESFDVIALPFHEQDKFWAIRQVRP
jgi:hypothetical protein